MTRQALVAILVCTGLGACGNVQNSEPSRPNATGIVAGIGTMTSGRYRLDVRVSGVTTDLRAPRR